jgi:hypothetical protein
VRNTHHHTEDTADFEPVEDEPQEEGTGSDVQEIERPYVEEENPSEEMLAPQVPEKLLSQVTEEDTAHTTETLQEEGKSKPSIIDPEMLLGSDKNKEDDYVVTALPQIDKTPTRETLVLDTVQPVTMELPPASPSEVAMVWQLITIGLY